jgi:cell wall-associated NlpC family hydrolase
MMGKGATPRTTRLTLLLLGVVAPLILACVGLPATTTTETASWVCPSPTPLPYGEAGPVKEVVRHAQPTAAPSGPVSYDEEPVYFEEWEQEYGDRGGPPFPSPTPYVVVGTTYSFGQRVRIPPLFAQVTATAADELDGGRQLYLVEIRWLNPTTEPIAMDYASQIALRAVTSPAGREVTSDTWRVSAESLRLSDMDELPTAVPTGESAVVVPIIAPAGEPKTVDVTMRRSASFAPVYAVTGTLPPSPTATVEASPTPNTSLQAPFEDLVVVQFVSARAAGPPCGSPGATTEYATEGYTVNGVADGPVAAPVGASRVVQMALNQVGKRYVWGAAGPETFDCSGLMIWSYAQVGIRVPARTSYDQYARLKPVDRAQLQPGDLVYFAQPGAEVSHVGMLAGDTDGDGTWDLVHAMSPRYGIRVTPSIFNSAYYAGPGCELCIVGFRTMR